VCCAPLADSFQHSQVISTPGRARSQENRKETRQPKPTPCEPCPLRVSVNTHTANQPSRLQSPRDSGWPTDSSALPKHTRDTDWRYFQSRCNPGKDTHWRAENVGASGTNQHRPIFLKRWKACLSPGVLGICRIELHPACTDERMP
jgi:hypothetical protein